MRKCRRQPRAAAGIASARPVAKCRCEHLLQQALRVPVPSPSADLQNSGASAAAAGSIASARPVPKCRFAEFRRERCCSRQHCECPSRPQVQICRIQARALLQQAALRVPVPSPSADFQISGARAAAAGSIASARPVPKCRFAEFRRERCCSRQHCECPSRPQVQISRFQARALLQQAALRVPVPSPSADFQISGARAAAAGSIASARPVPKCRFPDFRRERHERCSRQHCECPSRPQVQISRFQARAPRALQQAALRVPVPSPSADFQISGASATSAAAAV
ncbi:hypothetical protein OPV22_034830 [Ensete ventricosum]|uniref:Uncharacterized protein n=1 Tax=Ensete ventricosum TaxID=4639 RepID=A0AAV8PMW4_ENSVE|nr:hypothetical protein OPV22_034830 [Ensete ventricosum]